MTEEIDKLYRYGDMLQRIKEANPAIWYRKRGKFRAFILWCLRFFND